MKCFLHSKDPDPSGIRTAPSNFFWKNVDFNLWGKQCGSSKIALFYIANCSLSNNLYKEACNIVETTLLYVESPDFIAKTEWYKNRFGYLEIVNELSWPFWSTYIRTTQYRYGWKGIYDVFINQTFLLLRRRLSQGQW